MYTPNIITAPITEAVSLTELKHQLEIDTSDTTHDTELALYQKAARAYYEGRTVRTIHETELEFVLDSFPGADRVVLPRATPLISITSVKYTDSDGDEETFAAADYIADTDQTPGALVRGYGISWPSFTPYPASPIKIRYKAGIATDSPIAEASELDKIPILMHAAAMFENREAVVVSDSGSVAQIAVMCGAESFIANRQVEYAF